MNLQVFTLTEEEKWDSVVKSFSQYDVYYLSGYAKGLQLHGDGEPLLFYYDDGTTKGINVVMKRDIAKDKHFVGILQENTYFDFATPYGYGGWIVEGENTDKIFKEYENWCVKNSILAEFVRFHPVLENHKKLVDVYDVIPLGNTVAMDLSSPEVIWANITSPNRNMIRKAQKNGICIYSGRYPEIYTTFREIYNVTMDKNNADSYYYFGNEFYNSILNDLAENAQVFYAVYEEKIVAASIMLAANGRMNYHLSGSLREYANLAPSNLLLYKAALWGSENGCKTLHLGGGVGSGEDSLFKFKKAFYRGDTLPQFNIGKKIFNPQKYDELVNLRKDLTESGFFPKYRA